jgi:uncharacterized protein YuzE
MKKNEFIVKHDRQADAIYIYMSEEQVAYTKQLDNLRYIDYSSNHTPIGIELLCVSNGVMTDDLPFADDVARILVGKHVNVCV